MKDGSGKIIPRVLLPDGQGHLVYKFVTKCDTCGSSLVNKRGSFKWRTVEMIDDAVRPLYFCSEECKRGMEARIAANKGLFPNEKLQIDK